jgi:hypothetical protein
MIDSGKPIFGYVIGAVAVAIAFLTMLLWHGLKKDFFSMDIGNFAVGLGTIFVAYVSSRSILALNRQKVSEYQVRWIEELRHDTALYIKRHQNIMLARRSSISGKVPISERSNLLELSEVRARLQMMINAESSDQNEREFLDLISQDVNDEKDKAKYQRQEIIRLSRSVQKTAWKQAKSHILN